MDKRTIKNQAREHIADAVKNIDTWETGEDWEGNKIKSYFLGTVFCLYPSGKYYMPFACSNVELCPKCKGEGCDFCGHLGSREAFEDSVFTENLEHYASKHNCWIQSGEGNPCDVFLCKSLEQ